MRIAGGCDVPGARVSLTGLGHNDSLFGGNIALAKMQRFSNPKEYRPFGAHLLDGLSVLLLQGFLQVLRHGNIVYDSVTGGEQ